MLRGPQVKDRKIIMLRTTERIGDVVISGVLFCIGLFSILVSRWMPKIQSAVTGPGTFPNLLGILLCVVSLALGVYTLLHRESIKEVEIGHSGTWTIPVAIIVVGVFFERLGFVPMIAFFVGFFLKIFSNLGWIACVIFAAAAAISAYLFFNLLLGIPLP